MVDGFKEQIAELYEDFFGEIYAYCVYRLYSRGLAEDATSAVFLRLVEKYPALRGKDRNAIRSWLYGTASNFAAGYLRDAARHRTIMEGLLRDRQRFLRDKRIEDYGTDWPSVYEAVGRLGEKEQEIVIMRYLHGLQSPQIAAALGMSRVAVRVRLSRAIRTLRLALDKNHGRSHRDE